MHEVVDLAAVLLVLLHILWLFKAPDNSFSTLFPWQKEGRRQVVDDLKRLKSGTQLDGGPGSAGLIGLVQLGLLTASVMALSGLMLFLLMPEAGNKLSSSAGAVAEIHELVSNVM